MSELVNFNICVKLQLSVTDVDYKVSIHTASHVNRVATFVIKCEIFR